MFYYWKVFILLSDLSKYSWLGFVRNNVKFIKKYNIFLKDEYVI